MKHIFQNISKKISWHKFEASFSDAIERFPITVVAVTAASVLVIAGIVSEDLFSEEYVFRALITLSFAVWLSILWQQIVESGLVVYTRRYTGMASVVFVSCLYYFILPGSFDFIPAETVLMHMFIQGALVLAVTFGLAMGPYLRGTYQNERFYNYFISLGLLLIQSVVIAILLFVAGAAILGTLDLLFDISWEYGKEYAIWLVVAGLFVAPLYFVSQLPRELPQRLLFGETFFQYVVRYVAVPFIVIYTVILYTYSAKVLMSFGDWPQGEVSWIVILFSFFVYVVYVLSFNLRSEVWVERVHTAIPYLIIPQTVMLFYAIGLRIAQHGWTVNRYLVVAFGIWIVGISLYYIIARRMHQNTMGAEKARGDLLAIPFSLFVVIVIMLVSPVNMFWVSERSQTDLLGKNLVNVDILKNNGEITPLEREAAEALEQELVRSINSRIDYLCNYHGCDSLDEISPQLRTLDQSGGQQYPYEITNALGLEGLYFDRPSIENPYLSLYNDRYLEDVDISSYSHLVSITSNEQMQGTVLLDTDRMIVTINNTQVSIGDQVKALLEQLNKQPTQQAARFTEPFVNDSRDAQFTVIQGGIEYLFIVRNASGQREDGVITIEYFDGVVLY